MVPVFAYSTDERLIAALGLTYDELDTLKREDYLPVDASRLLGLSGKTVNLFKITHFDADPRLQSPLSVWFGPHHVEALRCGVKKFYRLDMAPWHIKGVLFIGAGENNQEIARAGLSLLEGTDAQPQLEAIMEVGDDTLPGAGNASGVGQGGAELDAGSDCQPDSSGASAG